jgi:hypothetical protein
VTSSSRETGIVRSIVRPAIVESASPTRSGWNEGFTTSAPLVYLAQGAERPARQHKLILDVVPSTTCARHAHGGGRAGVEQPPMVFQLSSGDLNPLHMDRVVTLTGLLQRKRFQDKRQQQVLEQLVARMEFARLRGRLRGAVDPHGQQGGAQEATEALGKVRPRWGAGRFTEVVDRLKKGLDEVERVTNEAAKNIELFRPFIFENAYILRADNARALFDRLSPEDQKLVPWGPQHLDWHDYWMNIHFPGLQKWVLPELDETYASKPKQVYSYHDLLELFETTTKLHATRTALRIERASAGRSTATPTCGAGLARGRLPAGPGVRAARACCWSPERSRVVDGILRRAEGGQDSRAREPRVNLNYTLTSAIASCAAGNLRRIHQSAGPRARPGKAGLARRSGHSSWPSSCPLQCWRKRCEAAAGKRSWTISPP